MLITASGQVFSSVGSTAIGALRGVDHTWSPMLINVSIKILLSFLLSWALMRYTDLEVYSPAVADLLISALIFAPLMTFYANKKLDEDSLCKQLADCTSNDNNQEQVNTDNNSGGCLDWMYQRFKQFGSNHEPRQLENGDIDINVDRDRSYQPG